MALIPKNCVIKKKNKYGETKIIYAVEIGDLEHNISLYQHPPTETISLEEFHEIGYRRLRVLQVIRDLKEKYKFGTKEFKDKFSEKVESLMPLAAGKCNNLNASEERRKDRIGHFILRLAFCKSLDQIKDFVDAELTLFRLRFTLEPDQNKKKFLQNNNLDLLELSSNEKSTLEDKLKNANKITDISTKEFWKVEFTKALDLVRGRKVLLWKGYVYLTIDDIIAVVAAKFRHIMTKSMNKEATALRMGGEDERIGPLLQRMVKNSNSSTYSKPKNANEITPDMVDELAKTSFAPCMRHIHARLRQDHHLRHFARRQYGLFLKDAGMPLLASIEFFRREFTKKIEPNKFDKEYAYNIRHMYGKEGGHREGRAYSCVDIITRNPPGSLDCHGCPFKHCEPDILSQRLELWGLNKNQIAEVRTDVNHTRYDKACTRVFEATHKMEAGSLGSLITHPNQYFALSRDIIEGKRSRVGPSSQSQHIEFEVKKPTVKPVLPNDDFDEEMEF